MHGSSRTSAPRTGPGSTSAGSAGGRSRTATSITCAPRSCPARFDDALGRSAAQEPVHSAMMWLREFIDAPVQAKIALASLALALVVSSVTDLRQRRIPNAVTYPAMLIVTACLVWLGGLSLLLESILGALVCVAPLALAMWRGWMGAGDVKLMAIAGLVSGAAAGWPFSLVVLLDVAIAGGVLALSWMLAARAGGQTRPRSVPYGVAIAAGTAWAFLMGTPLF